MDTFTDANWDREVLPSPVPVVVGFWAEWCVPCQTATPALAGAERSHGGPLRFGLVNYDENPALVQRYTVQGLPTVMVVRDGRAVARRVGLMGTAALEDFLRKHAARAAG